MLILDEPTVGVDPQSRNAIFDNLETLKRRGKALLYTTHYMEEAERLCDRIVIIDHGRVIADDTLQGLSRLVPASNVIAIELEDRAGAVPADRCGRWPASPLSRPVRARCESARRIWRPRCRRYCGGSPIAGTRYRHVVTERADLESVFLTLTGRTLRD